MRRVWRAKVGKSSRRSGRRARVGRRRTERKRRRRSGEKEGGENEGPESECIVRKLQAKWSQFSLSSLKQSKAKRHNTNRMSTTTTKQNSCRIDRLRWAGLCLGQSVGRNVFSCQNWACLLLLFLSCWRVCWPFPFGWMLLLCKLCHCASAGASQSRVAAN